MHMLRFVAGQGCGRGERGGEEEGLRSLRKTSIWMSGWVEWGWEEGQGEMKSKPGT
jgi:hypothetical protein